VSKFNQVGVQPSVSSPIRSEAVPSGQTFEGAPGFARESKSELFLLAVANMVGENTFYEKAGQRDDRYEHLIREVAVADPAWTIAFLRWLRGDANMRSASLVGAAEAVKARIAAKAFGDNRQMIDSVLQRPDEPGEMLAYWVSRHGRNVPLPVKNGVADAAVRLYRERALLKYDTDSKGYRFADVIELTRPKPADDTQSTLFRYAIDRRHGHGNEVPIELPMVTANAFLRTIAATEPEVLLDSARLREAGMTWEDVLSLAGSEVDKAALWSALIPSMGYMALLRNLRNFDESGVPDDVASTVAARLADPEQVAKSRQLPMRFLSAYRAAPSLRWAYPLEQALTHCLNSIPTLGGRTLVMVDTSSSMDASFSKDGSLMRWDAAVVFGVALAQGCASADVVSFSSAQRYWGEPTGALTKPFDLRPGESLLRSVDRWKAGGFFLGGGTATALAVRKHFAGHDRVVILTDEQAASDGGEVSEAVPTSTAMYTWNLAGYERGHAPSGGRNRHTFGGLTDAAFRMVNLIESGRNATWPWA
jgi:hypothetical protein